MMVMIGLLVFFSLLALMGFLAAYVLIIRPEMRNKKQLG